MEYNVFDEQIDRKGTGSLKHDFAAHRGKPGDVLPLWVADMDFQAPQCVRDALIQRAEHGIFGYSDLHNSYIEAVQGWFARRFDWHTEPEWLVCTPGVVFALCTAIRALTCEGDGIIIQQPVYYPFASSVSGNGRRLVVSELLLEDGRYRVDFDDFEKKIVAEKVKLFILCSPHNPVGRVWTEDELVRMGEICLRHGVTVVSDEIHADFVYPGHRHRIFANLRKEFADITVTCTAPSKTFNLAGLQVSNIFISNESTRQRFRAELARTGFDELGIMGALACRAAYQGGEPWLTELSDYLQGNVKFVRDFLRDKLPAVKLIEPEGTYLIWLDCRALGLNDVQLDEFMLHKAKLWLDTGSMFGAGGDGFQRVNIACPRATLEKAFSQLEKAVREL